MSTITAEQRLYAEPSSGSVGTSSGDVSSHASRDEVTRIGTFAALRMGRLQAWYDLRSAVPLLIADMVVAAIAASLAASAGAWAGNFVPPGFVLGVVAMTVLLQHSQSLYPACGTAHSIEFRRVLKSSFLVGAGTAIGLIFATRGAALPWTCWGVLCITLTLLAEPCTATRTTGVGDEHVVDPACVGDR